MDDQSAENISFIKDRILQGTYTKSQLMHHLNSLKDFLSFQLFESPESRKIDLAKRMENYQSSPARLSQPSSNNTATEQDWLMSLGADFYSRFDPRIFGPVFAKLEKELQAITVVAVYLPSEMPERELSKIGDWFKKNISPLFIFEAKVDPELIGGCALSFRGIYKDYSLRQKLQNDKQVILDNLKALKR